MQRYPMRFMRKGATLIELLVVASIMLTLAAVSVPTIKPMMESQVTSRAAATVSTYLERARSRAMTTGRPCGVTFEYFKGTCVDPTGLSLHPGSASLVLRQVETPPYYTGLNVSATVSVYSVPDNAFDNNKRVAWLGDCTDDYWDVILGNESSAKIQFNSMGAFYHLRRANSGRYFIELIDGIELPEIRAASFKVQRDPRATMTAPIGLAQGAVVDLECSGTDNRRFGLGKDVTVMFSPTGEVESVLAGGNEFKYDDQTIYLLIGRWDRISALATPEDESGDSGADDGLWNYEDDLNFWVTINPHTGLTTTTPLAQSYEYVDLTPSTIYKNAVVGARELARNSKRNLGGR